MGIYGAMATAISGMRAQSFALEQVSGNIANSQTTGYKRTESNFADLIPEAPPTRQVAGAVAAYSRGTNDLQGDIQTADTETYIAINGDGYFVIDESVGVVDGRPVFSGTDLYTRRGDFDLDKNGYLVNGAGYYLKGLAIDAETGNVSASVPQPIQLNNDFLPADATTEIVYRANLAAYPLTAQADENVANSELMSAASYSVDPTTAGAGTVVATDLTTFLEQSIAGGAITTYDSTGAPVNVQMRWAKTDSVSNGGADTWNLFYMTNANATGAQTAWQNVGQDYVFGANGQLSPAIPSVTISNLTVNGINLGNINLQHGNYGMTQFADSNGTAQVTELSQNGSAAGELVGVSISDSGRVVTTYSNGKTVEVAEVILASFNADNALKKLDGGAYAATTESGVAILGAGGDIIGAALEASNVDIADEFTKLIVTQQAYAAGTRIVTTSNDMLQEVLNMVR
ncbi:MAG: flagellar hook-basal body complex protein [Hyphomicrobiales bacterium]